MSQLRVDTPVTPSDNTVSEASLAAAQAPQAASTPALADAAALRAPAEVRAQAAMQAAANTNLQGAAAPGSEGLLSRIGRWLSEGVLRRGGLPETVTARMPDNTPVNFSGESLADMITSLPRLDRAAARAELPEVLTTRIRHGHDLLASVLAGHAAATPSAADISDIMLYIDARAHSTGNVFESGSYSIEDPAGHLSAYLNRCPEKYLRSSSHLNTMQKASLPEGHQNIHRGIDLPSGRNGALYGHATVLFGVIPGNEHSARRIFIKAESHGCRLNTLSAAEKRAGSDAVNERPWHASDIGNFFSHGISYLATRGKGSAAGSRKERIPDDVKKAYTKLLDAVKDDAYLSAALTRGNPLDKSSGVNVMLENMKKALLDPGRLSKDEMKALFAPVAEAMNKLTDASHLDVRIGNEMIFSSAELLGAGNIPRAANDAAKSYIGMNTGEG